MLGWVVGGVGTFVVSLAFAWVFLKMRCRGVGPPFGPHARPWGVFIAVATALVSTGCVTSGEGEKMRAEISSLRARLDDVAWQRFLSRYRQALLPQLSDTRPYFYTFKRILLWGRHE